MPNRMNWDDRLQIVKLRQTGMGNRDVAKTLGIREETASRYYHSTIRRLTKDIIREGAQLGAEKTLEAVKALTPTDPDDRKFALEAFKAFADRAGLSPQAAIQVNNQVIAAVQIQPLLAQDNAIDLKTVLKGEE